MKTTRTLLTALLLAPLAALHANAAPTPPSQRFVDDFSQPSAAWRYGRPSDPLTPRLRFTPRANSTRHSQ